MNNFDDVFAQLKVKCEGSTTLMLVKSVNASSLAINALSIFDELADYPQDILLNPASREGVVRELLGKAVKDAAMRSEK